MPWLQLVRWKNLLIVFLTQFLAWWCVVLPLSPQVLNALNFCCLALSTVLIAAAGYIINDYFDIKIDTINKPGKVVLEKIIPRKQAIIAHTVLNLLALLLAGYVAVQAHHYEWLLMQVGCTVLLWFYSTDFKRQYITGNLVVSLLTSLTVIVLVVYEPVVARSAVPLWLLAVYAYFAFMLTWMREIVKDMEDFKGDEAEGCTTMPVRRGLQYAQRFTIILCLLVVIPLAAASYLLLGRQHFLLALYVAMLILPLGYWVIFLRRDFTTQHYHKASRGLKVIMLMGICSLFVYYLQLYLHLAA